MLLAVSLLSGWLPWVVIVGAVATLLAGMAWQTGLWRRQLLVGLTVAVVVSLVTALVVDVLELISWDVPRSFYVWLGIAVLALAMAVVGWRSGPLWRRLSSILAILLTVAMAGLLVNGHYQYYPTLASLLGQEARFQTGLDQLDSLRDAARASGRLPANGVTVEVAIPGTESGFEARDAFVYLPPAWFADPPPTLPVLVLAPGVPSQTSDWTRGGDADGTADAFAAANGGKAPILAMIDTNGSIDADTECVDGPMGNVETYVVKDVPAYLRSQFGASAAAGSLAIGGLSAGGTCALLVSLRNPTVYPTFADFSGYQTPELDNAADTLQNLFGGSTEAQQAHDPATLMEQTKFPKSAGWFEAGTDDAQPAAAAAALSKVAMSSLGQTCVLLRPGGHDFTFWTAALQNALPWLSWRLGLTPVPASVPATCTPPLG